MTTLRSCFVIAAALVPTFVAAQGRSEATSGGPAKAGPSSGPAERGMNHDSAGEKRAANAAVETQAAQKRAEEEKQRADRERVARLEQERQAAIEKAAAEREAKTKAVRDSLQQVLASARLNNMVPRPIALSWLSDAIPPSNAMGPWPIAEGSNVTFDDGDVGLIADWAAAQASLANGGLITLTSALRKTGAHAQGAIDVRCPSCSLAEVLRAGRSYAAAFDQSVKGSKVIAEFVIRTDPKTVTVNDIVVHATFVDGEMTVTRAGPRSSFNPATNSDGVHVHIDFSKASPRAP